MLPWTDVYKVRPVLVALQTAAAAVRDGAAVTPCEPQYSAKRECGSYYYYVKMLMEAELLQ